MGMKTCLFITFLVCLTHVTEARQRSVMAMSVGHEEFVDMGSDEVREQRNRLIMTADGKRWVMSHLLNLGVRAFGEFGADAPSVDGEDHVTFREIKVSRSVESVRYSLGWQTVTWGETLGLPIADLVNVRRYDLSLLAGDKWLKEPNWLGQVFIYYGSATFELIAIPMASEQKHPDYFGSLPILEAPRPRWFTDAEGGFRLAYLTDFGLDTSLFFLTHMSRAPVYLWSSIDPAGLQLVLEPRWQRVFSVGLSSSIAGESFVIREDLVCHFLNPYTLEGNVVDTTQVRGVIGLDYSFADGLLLAAEANMEMMLFDDDIYEQRSWIALKGIDSFFRGRLNPEVVWFRGINNSDSWLRVKLGIGLSDTMTLTMSFHSIDGVVNEGILFPYDGTRTVSSELIWTL